MDGPQSTTCMSCGCSCVCKVRYYRFCQASGIEASRPAVGIGPSTRLCRCRPGRHRGSKLRLLLKELDVHALGTTSSDTISWRTSQSAATAHNCIIARARLANNGCCLEPGVLPGTEECIFAHGKEEIKLWQQVAALWGPIDDMSL